MESNLQNNRENKKMGSKLKIGFKFTASIESVCV